MGAGRTAPGGSRDERGPPLWPPKNAPLDKELVFRESWGGLIDRWQWTTHCFLIPAAGSDDDIAQLLVHRTIMNAALETRRSGRYFEDVLCDEMVLTLRCYLPERVRVLLGPDNDNDARRSAAAFLDLKETDQLMVALYDFDSLEGSRSSRHDQGRFRPEDLCRLLRLGNPETVRQRASRARARLRELLEKYS